MYLRSLFSYSVLILAFGGVAVSQAQEKTRNKPYSGVAVGYADSVRGAAVASRARPDFDPLGIRIDGFVFSPYTTSSILFDDNILSEEGSGNSDIIFRSQSGFDVESDWGRHMFGFGFEYERLIYGDESNENQANMSGNVKSRLDLYHDLTISKSFSLSKLHEGRGSSDALTNTALEPTMYRLYNGQIAIDKTFSRSKMQVAGSVQYFDYKDTPAVGGGTLDQDTRDGYIYTAAVRKSYGFSPGYSIFARFDYNFRDFEGGSNGTTNRDSDGVQGLLGLEFEVSRIMAGQISFGYLHQDYENASLSDASDFAVNTSLIWNPTKLMTLTLDINRVVSETTVVGASSHIDTTVAARVDYEILRNLIGSPYITYLFQDYQGISREDNQITTGVSLEYLINRRLRARSYYTYTNKESTDATSEFEKNVVGGELKVQF